MSISCADNLHRFYQICGILPIQLCINFKANQSKKLRRYSIFLLWCLSTSIFSVFYERDLFLNSKKSNVGETVDFIQLVLMRMSSIIIISEAFLTRQHLINYFNNLHDVDELMMKINVKMNFQAEQSQNFIKIFIILLLYSIFESFCLVTYKYRNRTDLLIYWISYMPFLFFSCIRYLQLMNLIIIIKRRIDIVNEKLKQITFIHQHSMENLQHLRMICYKLSIMSQMINLSFGLSTLINLANDFITITLNSYFTFVAFQNLKFKSIIKIIEIIFWSLPHCMNIIALATVCQLTLLSTNRTAMFLHRINFNLSKKQHSIFMSHFNLQLLQQKIQFHAFGFFNIDFTLLFAIAATVTTYLVILIQFHLSEKYKGTEMTFT
ncbi:hypothetical protein PVAND_000651 [Polypedilum vanderplanki]|uniref:Gustatory receptor n=1 Tax=Polypedilum vanderplanki TaxID=319348 RepID=A0A9J6BKT5_POLVA|nr:hypothetical protein PVAND_000651 [Polypedilum vanderplanki]